MRKAPVWIIGFILTSVGAFPVYADSILYSQTFNTQTVSSATKVRSVATVTFSSPIIVTGISFLCAESPGLSQCDFRLTDTTSLTPTTIYSTNTITSTTPQPISATGLSVSIPAGTYFLEIPVQGGGNTVYAGADASGNLTATITGTGGAGINWGAIYFPTVLSSTTSGIATTSGLWSKLIFASSSIDCISDNFFSTGICQAAAFLFVPDPGVIQQYVDLFATSSPSGFFARFPGSFALGLSNAFSNLTASSSVNVSILQLNLSAIDFATSSPFGSIFPATIVILSTTTISYYFGDSNWALLQSLIAAGIWLAFATDVFFSVRNRMHKV